MKIYLDIQVRLDILTSIFCSKCPFHQFWSPFPMLHGPKEGKILLTYNSTTRINRIIFNHRFGEGNSEITHHWLPHIIRHDDSLQLQPSQFCWATGFTFSYRHPWHHTSEKHRGSNLQEEWSSWTADSQWQLAWRVRNLPCKSAGPKAVVIFKSKLRTIQSLVLTRHVKLVHRFHLHLS